MNMKKAAACPRGGCSCMADHMNIERLCVRVIAFAVGNNGGRHDFRGRIGVRCLIVKENVCAEGREDFLFAHAAKKECFINAHTPVAQRFDCALVRRRAAGSDQRRADRGFFARLELLLQVGKGHQKMRKRAVRQGIIRVRHFVRLEGLNALLLVDALGLGGKKHSVAVKGDADRIDSAASG